MCIQVQKFTVLEKDFSMPGGELGEFLHAYQNSLHVVPKIVYTKLSFTVSYKLDILPILAGVYPCFIIQLIFVQQ